MIVPQPRLISLVGLVGAPLAILGATMPQGGELALAGLALIAVVALADALLSLETLRGLRVTLSDLVRTQKDRAAEFSVRVENPGGQPRGLRIGFAFPPEIEVESEDRAIELPAAEFSHIPWSFTGRKRGSYWLDRAYLEAPSRMGLWALRGDQPVKMELRVYPNLVDERKRVSALFLRRQQIGERTVRATGQGREFDKLREYLPGDGLHDIHWKATAKRRALMTKVFQIEQTQEVYVIVDASRLSAREVVLDDGVRTTVLERFVTAALLVGLAAEQQGDQFGLVTFNDRVQKFVRARNGMGHFDTCRDALYTLQPQTVSPDFYELCSTLRLKLGKRAMLIFLTALDDPTLSEEFSKAISLIGRQHLIFVNLLAPHATRPLFANGQVEQTSEVYRELAGHLQWRRLRELEKNLRRDGVRLNELDPTRLAAQVVGQLQEAKRRQLV